MPGSSGINRALRWTSQRLSQPALVTGIGTFRTAVLLFAQDRPGPFLPGVASTPQRGDWSLPYSCLAGQPLSSTPS